MANLSVNLPVPSADGAGGSVDTSTLGSDKTIVIEGNIQAILTVEVSEDGVSFCQVRTFSGPGSKQVDVVAQYMRVQVSGYLRGSATCTVGGQTATNDFASVDVPAGNGAGIATAVSTFGQIWTVIVGTQGDFAGVLIVEASQNGTDWGQVLPTFTGNGCQSGIISANFVRVRRSGYDQYAPGPATVTLGAMQEASGGGGGSGFPLNNITDFGASTAATAAVNRAAIQAAVDDAVANGIAGILIPGGTFDVGLSGTLSIDMANIGDFLIMGVGPKSILRMSGAGGGGAWALFDVPSTASRIWTKEVTFDGSAVTGAGNETHFFTADASALKFTDCIMQDCPGSPIKSTTGSEDIQLEDTYFFNNGTTSGLGALELESDVTRFSMSGCYAETDDANVLLLSVSPSGATAPDSSVVTDNIFYRSVSGGLMVSMAGVSSADLLTRFSFSSNIVLGGDVLVTNGQELVLGSNVVSGGVNSTVPALDVVGAVSYTTIENNMILREIGLGAAATLRTTGAATAGQIVMSGNILLQRSDASIAQVIDTTRFKATDNYLENQTAGANPGFGFDIDAATIALTQTIANDNTVIGNQGGGTLAAAFRPRATANINFLNIEDNTVAGAVDGVLFTSVAPGVYTETPHVEGNNFDVSGSALNGLSGATGLLVSRGPDVIQAVCIGGNIGANAQRSLCQNGSPVANGFDAPISSLYLQLDGGAGTSLWVKEAATSAGWASK
jgi:hypothetical protein